MLLLGIDMSQFNFTARNEVGARLCFYTCLRFLFTGGGGSWSLGVSSSWGVSIPGGVSAPGGLCPGGSLPRGISVQGVSVRGGLCFRGVSVCRVSVWGGLCHGDPAYGNERAVRILLECILVEIKFEHHAQYS